MTWATPKTDWNSNYVPSATDLNRIEGNTLHIGLTLGTGTAMEVITAADSLDITATTNLFSVTGTTNISYIKTTGRATGAVIYLKKGTGTNDFVHMAAAPGAGYAKINLGNSGLLPDTDEGDMNVFLYDGTVWNLISTTNVA